MTREDRYYSAIEFVDKEYSIIGATAAIGGLVIGGTQLTLAIRKGIKDRKLRKEKSLILKTPLKLRSPQQLDRIKRINIELNSGSMNEGVAAYGDQLSLVGALGN